MYGTYIWVTAYTLFHNKLVKKKKNDHSCLYISIL